MDDLISRQAVLKLLSTIPPEEATTKALLIQSVKQMDAAQPERKTGKWNTYYHSDIDFSHSCNQCGYSAPYQMIGGEVFQKKWNFCPHCGARMEDCDERV